MFSVRPNLGLHSSLRSCAHNSLRGNLHSNLRNNLHNKSYGRNRKPKDMVPEVLFCFFRFFRFPRSFFRLRVQRFRFFRFWQRAKGPRAHQ